MDSAACMAHYGILSCRFKSHTSLKLPSVADISGIHCLAQLANQCAQSGTSKPQSNSKTCLNAILSFMALSICIFAEMSHLHMCIK